MVALKSTPKSDLAIQYRGNFHQCWHDASSRSKDHAMLSRTPYLRLPGLAIVLSAILLSGCASQQGRYPSLAIRDAERVQGSLQPPASSAESSVESPLSADLVRRLAQLQSSATSAHRAFMDAAPGTRRLVEAAAGTDVTNDRWASAQVALASLESARSQSAVPLGDLDLLHADAAIALEQRAAIEETRAAVTGLIAQEDAILANLRGKTPS